MIIDDGKERKKSLIVIADAVAICWTVYIVIYFIKIDPTWSGNCLSFV